VVPTLQPKNDGPYELHTADLSTKTLFPRKVACSICDYTHEQSLDTCVQAFVL